MINDHNETYKETEFAIAIIIDILMVSCLGQRMTDTDGISLTHNSLGVSCLSVVCVWLEILCFQCSFCFVGNLDF